MGGAHRARAHLLPLAGGCSRCSGYSRYSSRTLGDAVRRRHPPCEHPSRRRTRRPRVCCRSSKSSPRPRGSRPRASCSSCCRPPPAAKASPPPLVSRSASSCRPPTASSASALRVAAWVGPLGQPLGLGGAAARSPPRSPLLLGRGKEDGDDLPGSGLLHALRTRAAEESPRRSDPLRGSALPPPTRAQAYGAPFRLGPSLGLGPF